MTKENVLLLFDNREDHKIYSAAMPPHYRPKRCQEPPITDGWNVSFASSTTLMRVVLEHAQKFSRIQTKIGFQPPVINWWKISDIFVKYIKRAI